MFRDYMFRDGAIMHDAPKRCPQGHIVSGAVLGVDRNGEHRVWGAAVTGEYPHEAVKRLKDSLIECMRREGDLHGMTWTVTNAD